MVELVGVGSFQIKTAISKDRMAVIIINIP
jgi:hypothetical protein